MSLFRAALILGLLSAVGPFAIDMYLPALPTIAADLQADVATVQWTLTAYFMAFGVAQLLYGPWADQAGRRRPLFFGLGVFIAGSVWSAVAGDINHLIAARILQGFGGAVLMVVPRAVIRDMHTGSAATRLMAMVMLVISVSPMLAPFLGSGIIAFGDWRMIFWVLCIAAGLSLLMVGFVLPETLAPEARVKVNLKSLWAGTKTLFRDPVFMGLTLIGGFGFSSFMVFIASASFVYSEQFGLTPTGFSLAFAINAIGFAAASAVLFLICLAGFGTLPVVVAGLFVAKACLGLIIPTTMVMALDPHGSIAGLASSLGGTLQMLVGGLMVAITGLFFNGTATPMVGAIALCSALALALALFTFRKMARP